MGNDLGMQYIMDGNGNYYTVNGKDQLVVARDRDEAGVFTFFEANQRIGGGKKARFYHTIPVEDLEETENEMLEQIEEESVSSTDSTFAKVLHLVERMVPSDESEEQIAVGEVQEENQMEKEIKKAPSYEYSIEDTNWNEFVNYFIFLSTRAKGYYEELTADLSEIDKEICDLLHYVELYDLSDDEGLRAMDLLKDARQRRRDVKDEMFCVDCFQRMLGTSANVTKARGMLKDLGKLDTRRYLPRHLDGLFDGMSDRMTDRDLYRQCRVQQTEEPVEEYYEEETAEEEIAMSYVETVFDHKENDWLGFARQQMEFYQNAGQYMVNLQLEMDAIDDAIEDIMNRIEDANYNVAQGYKVFKELKDLRTERKAKAQELEMLRTMTECFNLNSMAEALAYNVEAIEKMTATTVEEVTNQEAV